MTSDETTKLLLKNVVELEDKVDEMEERIVMLKAQIDEMENHNKLLYKSVTDTEK